MNKKNKVIAIISIVFIIVLSFFTYKGIMLHKYSTTKIENYDEIINGLSFDQTMNIYKKTINENEYVIIDDIKIRNDFNTFKKTEKQSELDSIKYILYDENNKVKSAIFIGKMDSYVNIFTSEELVIFNGKDNGQFNDTDRKNFLLKNNINNDVDLLKYIRDNYYLKNNLFTSVKKMKENYVVNTFVEVALPSVSSTTIVLGDYTGFIFNLKNNIREVHIFKNNKSYIFTFMGEEFTKDSYIQDLLSTLEIK